MATWKQYRSANGSPRAVAEYLRVAPSIWGRRAANRWHDLRAILSGYCNHSPYSAIPGEGGGYAHWRCALPRRHEGMHRFHSYVWDATGRTDYLPVPRRQAEPSQPWGRSMTMTRRQDRQRDRWLNRRYAERARTQETNR